MKKFTLLAIVCVAQLLGANHVRVILDDSGSMNNNDSYRLAPNAVMVLYDLVQPNTTLPPPNNDSFEVATLESGKTQPAQHFSATDGREALSRELTNAPYSKANTYYVPALEWAINGLKSYSADDRKVIVLVTDGAPEDNPARLNQLRTDLVPLLARYSIRLYIIAIGHKVDRKTIQNALGGSSVAGLLEDPDGKEMLTDMIEIFSLSFGYSAEKLGSMTGPRTIDLEGGESPEKVAIVNYALVPTPPRFNVKHPAGKVFNSRGSVESSTTIPKTPRGSSVVTNWALAPDKGLYTFEPLTSGSIAAILRPVRINMVVQPRAAGEQVVYTMATKPFNMRVVARSAKPGSSPPADAALSFRSGGPRWQSLPSGPFATGTLSKDATYFDIAPEFQEPGDGEDHYEGWVDIDLKRKESRISPPFRYLVDVYPYLDLHANPIQEDATVNKGVRALARRETGCAEFTFEKDKKDRPLPHPGTNSYLLQATLDPAAVAKSEFDGARFLLDNQQLDIDGYAGPERKKWSEGIPQTREQLLGSHKVCVQIGHVIRADPRAALDVPIIFRLQETPYSTQGGIGPFTLKVLVAPPSWAERWAPMLALGLGMLTTFLLLWFGRYKPTIPSRLRYAAAQAGAPLMSVPLGPGRLHQTLLGLSVERALSLDGSRLLGWVRPLKNGLYDFVPADSSTRVVDELEPQTPPASERQDKGRLQIYRTYKAITKHGDYFFRLDYA